MSHLSGVQKPDDSYEVLQRELLFDGKIFKVFREHIRLPGGVEAVHELLHYPSAVSIIPILEEHPGEPEIILVEQLRNAVRGVIHEIPAGMMEAEEDPLTCARRELEEETGYTAQRWTHVTSLYPTPGISGVPMVYFLAEGLEKTGQQSLDPTECLTARRWPLDRLIEAVVFGKEIENVPRIVDGKTHMAIYYLAAIKRHEQR